MTGPNDDDNPDVARPGEWECQLNCFEEAIYQWGRLLTTFYPAGRWGWEKEWERRRSFD